MPVCGGNSDGAESIPTIRKRIGTVRPVDVTSRVGKVLPTPRWAAWARVNEMLTSPGRAGSGRRPDRILRCQNLLGTALVSGAKISATAGDATS